MSIRCSFSSVVGSQCSYDRRDKQKSTEVVPLLSCEKDVKCDVKCEVDLILSRASLFVSIEESSHFTICPMHRSSLGIGWRRTSNICKVPPEISQHRTTKKIPKAERGMGKHVSQLILHKTGHFLPVGTGKSLGVNFVVVCTQSRFYR